MIGRIFVCAVVGGLVGLLAGPSAADDGGQVGTESNGFIVSWDDSQPGAQQVSLGADPDPVVNTLSVPSCAQGGAQTCNEPALCDDGDVRVQTIYMTASGVVIDGGSSCDRISGSPTSTVTPGAVARAFRRLPLPGAVLVVQPPGGRTLVNFETNFYTERGGFSRSVRLLGRVVELRIWPASFTWRFGDGAEETSSEPGAAYPDLQITHRYERRGVVAPSVDVTYAAQFRVEGGAWRDVEGMVRIPGAPESLRVVTARPVLVGG